MLDARPNLIGTDFAPSLQGLGCQCSDSLGSWWNPADWFGFGRPSELQENVRRLPEYLARVDKLTKDWAALERQIPDIEFLGGPMPADLAERWRVVQADTRRTITRLRAEVFAFRDEVRAAANRAYQRRRLTWKQLQDLKAQGLAGWFLLPVALAVIVAAAVVIVRISPIFSRAIWAREIATGDALLAQSNAIIDEWKRRAQAVPVPTPPPPGSPAAPGPVYTPAPLPPMPQLPIPPGLTEPSQSSPTAAAVGSAAGVLALGVLAFFLLRSR